ncbi:hypothetical protein [Paenibacillus polymyxa]|uniref:hypothetical protein n=1 Tax=Paenibacillus polymyxa TaxID=1406 RepID=UPI0006C1DDF4|nr:hypothetical protein [Paenibacillus polymyxa]KOS00438.1 hypothetical protein AM598_22835 [Paenibacillus polymyxa]
MSNVNKPVIPAEVADAIELMRCDAGGQPWDNEKIIDSVRDTNIDEIHLRKLRSVPFDTLLAALVNGYTRELTTEEQERKRTYTEIAYTLQRHTQGDGRYDTYSEDSAFADGVQYTLDMLGIYV